MTPTKFTLLLLLVIGTTSAAGQPRTGMGGGRQVIRYTSSEDSLQLLMVQQKIDELVAKKKFSQKTLDSLMDHQRRLFKNTYYVTIYEPRKDFILSDSLEKIQNLDDVYRVSVFKKKEIPAIVFRCKNLLDLEIISCAIDELPQELNLLPNLTRLYLFNNVSKGRLRLPKNNTIKRLDIKTRNPGYLPKSYKNFHALDLLDLSENKLTRFPNGARKNKHLKELNLQRNDLTLEHRLRKHKSLERLALHGNKITTVPGSIKKFPNVKKLNFNINSITSVHRNIGKLKKLEQLSFYNNKLSAIPNGVYALTSLLEIDLFYNEIEEIAPEFVNWKNLTTLYLSHNKLTVLPADIDKLTKLSGIYVWDNRIGQLPESIGNMPQLKFLRINHNYLKEIPKSFYSLPNIEEIDFSHNYITAVDEAIFNYPQLHIIALVNNPWTEETWDMIRRKTEEVRKREVFVHISEE